MCGLPWCVLCMGALCMLHCVLCVVRCCVTVVCVVCASGIGDFSGRCQV